MKEIKFRAWNGGMMRYSGTDDILLLENVLLAPDEMGDKWKFREWPLMQFTGLKDKNGKEIYEGDVVLNNGSTSQMGDQEIVEFIDGGAFPFAMLGWECTIDPGRCEILGNIYENTELKK